MMKNLFTFATAMLCICIHSYGQNLAIWSLDSNPSPDSTAANVSASDLQRGQGITTISYTSEGATANAWPVEATPGLVDYYEVCVQADSSHILQADSLYFTEQRSQEGISYYEIRVSTDNFQTATLLQRDTVPDNPMSRDAVLSKLGLTACDGQQLCFRWYAFGSEDYTGTWSLSDIKVAGTAPAACTPPALPVGGVTLATANATSADFNWEHETGEHFLVIAREMGQPEYLPCEGTDFTANGIFGSGTDFGQGNYVVYAGVTDTSMTGSFTISGLESGQAYEITALAYDPTGFCYGASDALRLDFMTTCNAPSPSANLQGHPGDAIAYLNWETPLCYDEVLVLGSKQPITDGLSSTDGSAYTADTVFAMGISSSMDLSTGVYPLYQGTGTRATITGLAKDTTYFFRVYTRYAGAWVAGPEVSLAPKEPCSNGDYLFISELHYRNTGTDVDEGVEVTGEAGLDLSHYQIDYYYGYVYAGTVHLSDTIVDQINGVGAHWVPLPDPFDTFGAVCLYNKVSGQIVELYAYRSSASLDGGVADGMSAENTGVLESDTTPVDYSLQRSGDGACPSPSSEWVGPMQSSRGIINTEQGAPLPISLIDFKGKLVGKTAVLTWSTATELNNDYMAVEHSTDGRSFSEMGRVRGAGTTQQPQHYSLTDPEPAAGVNYYRLRQVDFDGQYEYFGPVSVRLAGPQPVLRVYPTATQNQLTLEFTSTKREKGMFLIFNALGQLQRRLPHDGSSTRIPVDVTALPSGQYTLMWRSERQPLVAQPFTKL